MEDKELQTMLDTEDAQQPVEQEVEQKVEQPQETDAQLNWRKMREDNERLQKQRDELYAMLLKNQQAAPQPPAHREEYDDIDDDEYVQAKQLKQYRNEMRAIKDEMRRVQQESITQSTEARLRSEFPDFSKVVNPSTVEALKSTYPAIAKTIGESTDLYGQGYTAYTLIKKLGIYQEDYYEPQRQRAHVNNSKPKPINTIASQQSDEALSQANRYWGPMSKEEREMERRALNEAKRSRD